MRILRFNDDQVGVVKDDDRVVDVSSAIYYRVEKGPKRVIEEVIEDFEEYREKFQQIANRESGVPLSSVRLLVPIPQPNKCLAAFVNYLDRPDRTVESLTIEYFYKAPELVGPEGTIELADIPPVTVFHPEAELAFVMGKRAKNVKLADAMNFVFGYVPFFDISARGMTRRTQFLPKGQDTYATVGPWITTRDEIPDPHNLVVKSWVNGQARQNYNTKYMAYKIPEQISWLSRFVQLCPGDVIATGTYHEGLGPLNGGDTLEIEIERLGKTKFHVKSYGARKEVNHIAGRAQTPAGGWTKV
jgi:2-keto-4-pentenoate hydratase/2-oxohepta-3-ene-1,7-dioic acid hydratase in catechol pathway